MPAAFHGFPPFRGSSSHIFSHLSSHSRRVLAHITIPSHRETLGTSPKTLGQIPTTSLTMAERFKRSRGSQRLRPLHPARVGGAPPLRGELSGAAGFPRPTSRRRRLHPAAGGHRCAGRGDPARPRRDEGRGAGPAGEVPREPPRLGRVLP
jgi:hypothetical protein